MRNKIKGEKVGFDSLGKMQSIRSQDTGVEPNIKYIPYERSRRFITGKGLYMAFKSAPAKGIMEGNFKSDSLWRINSHGLGDMKIQ